MNQREIKERAAAGSRACEKKPVAFVFRYNGDWSYDHPNLIGLPVYQSSSVTLVCDTTLHGHCPIIPLFAEENLFDTKKFCEAFLDYEVNK